MPGGKCVFNDQWLELKLYKDWILRAKSQHDAFCSLCHKTFDIGNMGEAALKCHSRGEKHQNLSEIATKKGASLKMKDFCATKTPTNVVNMDETQQVAPGTSSENLNTFSRVTKPLNRKSYEHLKY